MEAIAFKYKPSIKRDKSGNPRYFGTLPSGQRTYRSRLVMMNFLHCSNLPRIFSVHHVNVDTLDDRIENLQLMKHGEHVSLHHPKDCKFGVSHSDDSTAYERERRKQPHIREAVAATSLRYYHRNRDCINADPDKKQYKAEWYMGNRKRICNDLKDRYRTDPVYREKCLQKAKLHKLTIKQRRANA